MNSDNFERRSKNLSKTMETQIVSMLNDVIDDKKKPQIEDIFDDDVSQERILFQDEDSEREDDADTQSNTDQTLSNIFIPQKKAGERRRGKALAGFAKIKRKSTNAKIG